MDQLRFTGLHADGTHLMVSDEAGTEYAVPLDERLQAALRRRRADADRPATPITPREVQSLFRSGMSSQEIAEHTGWERDRVQRYEGPIVAEREHVARLACAAHVRTHDRTGPPPTLQGRAEQRLAARGVDLEQVQWDAIRPEGGQWSVLITFVAGQRSRQASWRFDPAARSLDALDDEARWLSEDEQSLPRDVSAETVFGGQDASEDLMTSMRERSRKRGRGRRARPGREATAGADTPTADESGSVHITTGDRDSDTASQDPGSLPGRVTVPGEALPLEDFPYDPETMGLPPSAHGHAESGRPAEPEGPREATLEDFFGDFDEDHDGDEPLHDAEQDEQSQARRDEDDEQAVAAETDAPAEQAGDHDAGEGASARRRSRPSVPSWDDIMFGARGR